jgi:hypothetical protein
MLQTYYKLMIILLIEGYLSLEIKNQVKKLQNSKKIEITVLKVYPFLLSYSRQINKI